METGGYERNAYSNQIVSDMALKRTPELDHVYGDLKW